MAFEGMDIQVSLCSGMTLSRCKIGSYLSPWLLTSGIVRAIEFTDAIRFIDSDS